jgi:hypothetical protein
VRIFKLITIVSLSILFVAACSGAPMKVQNPNPDKGDYTIIGHGEAEATGLMIAGFIPVRQNDRFIRAQNAAIERNGGDAMINTTIHERWFWAFVLNGYTTTVSGDIIKYNNK